MKNRQILHVDMNSFFATAEQQANPHLRGRPVVVRGSKSERTIVVASSIEAKKIGIKTGHLIHEVKEIYPEIKVVVGEPKKYSHILSQLIDIFSKYTDIVEIFSIDECFLDVTNSAHLFTSKPESMEKSKHETLNSKKIIDLKNQKLKHLNLSRISDLEIRNSGVTGAINIAKLIKEEIKDEIGEWMTCSIGIAENKFLAKLGSDLKKPDGLVIITPNCNKQITKYKQIQNLNIQAKILTTDEVLLNCGLEDFCGIGKRINIRLKRLGINTVKDLRETPGWKLKKEFGIYGFKMKNWAHGIDNSKVISYTEQKEAKSFSKSRTLNKNVTSKTELKKTLYLLCEVLGSRMRKENYWGTTIGLWLRYSSFSGTGKNKKIKKWICDGHEIFKYAEVILDEIELRQAVRAIGVRVSNVQPQKNVPHLIFEEEKGDERIIDTIDLINNKYGDLSLMRASVCNVKLKEVVSGMGRKNTEFL